MFNVTFKSNFDAEKLLRQAKESAAEQLAQKCKIAASAHGGVIVKIERAADGTPRKMSFQGSDAAVAAATRALA